MVKPQESIAKLLVEGAVQVNHMSFSIVVEAENRHTASSCPWTPVVAVALSNAWGPGPTRTLGELQSSLMGGGSATEGPMECAAAAHVVAVTAPIVASHTDGTRKRFTKAASMEVRPFSRTRFGRVELRAS